jgi:hypothetical protein
MSITDYPAEYRMPDSDQPESTQSSFAESWMKPCSPVHYSCPPSKSTQLQDRISTWIGVILLQGKKNAIKQIDRWIHLSIIYYTGRLRRQIKVVGKIGEVGAEGYWINPARAAFYPILALVNRVNNYLYRLKINNMIAKTTDMLFF